MMNSAASLSLVIFLACAAAGEGVQTGVQNTLASQGETPEAIVQRWPARARNTARLLLEKYGHPDQFDRGTLAWFSNGAWKSTIVRRKRADYLEQTVGYLVPHDKIDDLKRFSPRIQANPTAGELTFASESEATNRLALNLADEVVTGKRGAADARAFFAKMSRLAASGKSSSYLDALLFDVDNTRRMAPTGADQ